ncbi:MULTISPECIES: hypothetical protein [Bacteria]|uniref:hypothetical protein n=1 Tax=Bacteria TaxID=2 RepID=UPI002B25079E|nr:MULTISPECIES: hypothetical protein [Bacteria]MEB2538378.1 hypothetical protein [Micrococcus luteus]MEB2616602.1 hypothetical protein [Bacillus cereus]MEB2620402.1 hypothetical protein [Kocuria rosea]MEB2654910.1 hypothetical protein [Pseudomonas siliginis]
MVNDFLTTQEKRELFEEYKNHLRRREVTPQQFEALCRRNGIDEDDIKAALAANERAR